MRGAGPSICFVAPSGVDAENQIARHVLSVAARLAKEGWTAHILWSGGSDQTGQTLCDYDGVTCTWMASVKPVALLTLDGPNLFPALHTSDRVLNALRQLHGQHSFDLIEFPERGGLGFRAVQAKETGQAFEDVGLVVTLHGPSVVERHHDQRWSSLPEELTLDYAEHYAFAHADGQLALRSDLLAETQRLGWMVRFDAEQWWYRGNGNAEMVSDDAFIAMLDAGKVTGNAVLYGNEQSNAAAGRLCGASDRGCMARVKSGEVTVGDGHTVSGDDLGVLAVGTFRNAGTSGGQMYALVGGTGVVGMRATDRFTYLLSGVGVPDVCVLRAGLWSRGVQAGKAGSGVECAGFLGGNLTMEGAEILWSEGEAVKRGK